jgi:pimeloyl-ACP methyl ester carboxylesterase
VHAHCLWGVLRAYVPRKTRLGPQGWTTRRARSSTPPAPQMLERSGVRPDQLEELLEAIRQRLLSSELPLTSSPRVKAVFEPEVDASSLVRAYSNDKPCSTLVVAFGSLGGQHDFQSACRGAAIDHALFLRDARQAWFLLGIGGDPDRRFEATLSAVATEVNALRPRRLVLLGTSMGAFAAVRTASELQADVECDVRVLVFAPQVVLDPQERYEVLNLPPMPFDANLCAVKRAWVAQGRGDRLPSAIDGWLQRDSQRRRVPAMEVHVGDRSPADLLEARLLKHAAAEPKSMRVVVHAGMGHKLAESLRDEMLLEPMLSRMVATGSTDSETLLEGASFE